jgi:hypothetical protein
VSSAPDLPPESAPEPVTDPVLVRRAQIAGYLSLAQKIGYGLFALFMVLVIAAFITGFPAAVTKAATICLILGSVVLAPTMFFAYTVKAADRADREGDWR